MAAVDASGEDEVLHILSAVDATASTLKVAVMEDGADGAKSASCPA